jgi:hypothetical protein
VSLALLTKHLRVRIEKKKRSPSQANKSNKGTQEILSQVLCTRVDLGTLSGSIALIVSWSGGYCSCIECNVQNTWVVGVVVVGGIYSPHHQSGRWGMAAGDGRIGQSGAPPDRHCRLSGASPRHPTIRVREQSNVGAIVFLWHRTVRCASDFCSDFWRALFAHRSVVTVDHCAS